MSEERVITHIADLMPDAENARQHNPRNVGTITDALHEVGAARSIVVDENGVILAGNATIEAAAQAGIERVQVVDADGETIIAVRRRGLTPEQKKRLAYFDNRSAELATWDHDQILADWETGLDFAGLFYEEELQDLMVLAAPLSLDDLEDEYGNHDAENFWPIISLKVPPEVYDLYESLMLAAPGEDEAQRFAAILKAAGVALSGSL